MDTKAAPVSHGAWHYTAERGSKSLRRRQCSSWGNEPGVLHFPASSPRQSGVIRNEPRDSPFISLPRPPLLPTHQFTPTITAFKNPRCIYLHHSLTAARSRRRDPHTHYIKTRRYASPSASNSRLLFFHLHSPTVQLFMLPGSRMSGVKTRPPGLVKLKSKRKKKEWIIKVDWIYEKTSNTFAEIWTSELRRWMDEHYLT